MSDIVQGPIGTVGQYDVAFKDGQFVVTANVTIPPGESAAIILNVDAKKVLTAIADAVPGKLDNIVIAIIEKALGI